MDLGEQSKVVAAKLTKNLIIVFFNIMAQNHPLSYNYSTPRPKPKHKLSPQAAPPVTNGLINKQSFFIAPIKI